MIKRTVSPDDLARLKVEREAADRRYNEALTALDSALHGIPDLPHPPPAPDEHQITPLNERWKLLNDLPPTADVQRWPASRVAQLVWRMVAPTFERQQAFNSALVDHLNRNLPIQRENQRAIASTLEYLKDRLSELHGFESRLLMYLQQLTPYVDTKDHEFAGLAVRRDEDARELTDVLDHRSVALGGAISGVGDELAKRWESMVLREQRFEARTTALAAAHDDLRQVLASVQQAASTIKREFERLPQQPPVPGTAPLAAPSAPSTAPASGGGQFEQARASTLDAYKYVGFEDRFRGTREDIQARLEEYVPYFEGASDVLDVGCGRGEFLDTLTERGITCRGLDLNREMVEVCRGRGLQVDEGDALSFLNGLPDGSLGGLIAAQVVEHLQPDYLLSLVDAAYHKLRPGSRIILETINPACWFAFFASYIRDITHVRPLHPDTLSYFVQASGFQRVTVRFRAPYPEHEKLQPVQLPDVVGQTLNANVEKLNRLLFTYMDYAVIGERL
ncbi:MAG: class I SAM-dependent methyltransferase [Vicinamibacterales bacterium]